jgi:hypothetical protein
MGRNVPVESSVSQGVLALAISRWASGVYFLRIEYEGRVAVGKVVKE